MSEADDIEQVLEDKLDEAVTLTELRDHLRSFVTQLDDAPSEPVMLPWLADHEDSPQNEGLGRSPSLERAQLPGAESAAFSAGTRVTWV